MANIDMTFNEYFGTLPKRTLRLVKRFNVSPVDFDMMLDLLNPGTATGKFEVEAAWAEVDAHILENSSDGYYRPRRF